MKNILIAAIMLFSLAVNAQVVGLMKCEGDPDLTTGMDKQDGFAESWLYLDTVNQVWYDYDGDRPAGDLWQPLNVEWEGQYLDILSGGQSNMLNNNGWNKDGYTWEVTETNDRFYTQNRTTRAWEIANPNLTNVASIGTVSNSITWRFGLRYLADNPHDTLRSVHHSIAARPVQCWTPAIDGGGFDNQCLDSLFAVLDGPNVPSDYKAKVFVVNQGDDIDPGAGTFNQLWQTVYDTLITHPKVSDELIMIHGGYHWGHKLPAHASIDSLVHGMVDNGDRYIYAADIRSEDPEEVGPDGIHFTNQFMDEVGDAYYDIFKSRSPVEENYFNRFAGYLNTGQELSLGVGVGAAEENQGDFVSIGGGNNALQGNLGDNVTSGGGFQNLRLNTADDVTSTGYRAGEQNEGARGVLYGSWAGFRQTGDRPSFFGYEAGRFNIGRRRVAIGYESGGSSTNTDATGDDCTYGGYQSGLDALGSENSGWGYQSFLQSNTRRGAGFGTRVLFDATSSDNVAAGYLAMEKNTTDYTQGIGSESGYENSGEFGLFNGAESGKNNNLDTTIYIGHFTGLFQADAARAVTVTQADRIGNVVTLPSTANFGAVGDTVSIDVQGLGNYSPKAGQFRYAIISATEIESIDANLGGASNTSTVTFTPELEYSNAMVVGHFTQNDKRDQAVFGWDGQTEVKLVDVRIQTGNVLGATDTGKTLVYDDATGQFAPGITTGTNVPNYATTALAAADSALASGAMFKVPNGDGTSAIHFKD